MAEDKKDNFIADNAEVEQNSQSLPFPMLFAEDVPAAYLEPIPGFDMTEKLAQILGKAGPTGHRDKILILSNPRDPHADRVTVELVQRGAPVCRFHTEEFLKSCRLSIHLGNPDKPLGIIELPTYDLALDEVKSVWFRRPELPLYGPTVPFDKVADFVNRESEAALYGLFGILNRALWVSHPYALKASDNKLAQLKLAESFGFLIPRTLVTNNPQLVREFYDSCGGEMIIKTFRGWSGPLYGKMRAILTTRILPEHLDHLDLVQYVPCLFQEYVPKDVEFRITIIGRQCFAAEIHSQRSPISRDDWRWYDLENTPYYPCKLPPDIEKLCLRLLDHYDLAFGAIDMIRRPDGAYVFLELNANGQWLWIQKLTGFPMVETMADMLIRGSIN